MIATVRDSRDLDALLARVRFRPRSSLGAELLGRWARGERPSGRPAPARRPLAWLSLLLLVAGVLAYLFQSRAAGLIQGRTVDRCCADLDGGGEADDGLLVTSRLGFQVSRLAVYEDRDGSGGYTSPDAVRFSRSGRPSLQIPLATGMRTFEVCCQDYDGGGPADDAVVIVALPPDRIAMAAIYERPGRSLR